MLPSYVKNDILSDDYFSFINFEINILKTNIIILYLQHFLGYILKISFRYYIK